MSDPEKPQSSPPGPRGGTDENVKCSADAFRQTSQAGIESRRSGHEDDRWESESLFRHIADTAPVLIWMACNGKFRFWFNKPWLDFTGRSMEENYWEGWQKAIHPDDFALCMEVYESSHEAHKSFKIEYRLRRHDGKYRWILEHGVPCFAQDGEFIGFTGSCIDITGRKHAEDQLRESQENLTALVQATSQVVWTFTAEGMGEDTLAFWQRITGQSREELEHGGWVDAVHPADRARIQTVWNKALEQKVAFETDYRILNSDNAYQHFEVSGVPVLNSDGSFRIWIGTMSDITERVRSQEALRCSEERLRMLVASATEFAILTLDEESRIKSWSDGAQRLFGYAEQEILGRAMSLLFTAEDRRNGVPQRELATAKEHGYAVDERWHVRKDGSLFFASGVVSPIRGSDPLEFVKIARDLTHRKEMEEALKEADRRKNEFLATLAHELRNPLAPIRSGLDLLKRASSDPIMTQRTLAIIERQTDQIVHLVDDLLDISRITRGKINLKKKAIELSSIIQQAVESSHDNIEAKGHQLTVSLPPGPVYLNADAVRIKQVLLNILDNAVKYTKRGGKISLILETAEQDAVIRVIDSGIGIPATKLNEVFGIFHQIDEHGEEARSGLGIGLSVVRGLVEMHGGSVCATSPGSGQGSEFVVRLPRIHPQQVPADPEPAEPPTLPQPPPQNPRKRVLLVDDNRDAARMLETLLSLQGHEVELAFDGESAVREAERFRPDICLCDLGLPKMDGFEVARRLSRSLPDTLLISLSGWGQDEDRRRSHAAGFSHHLVKPVKIDELISLLA
jgi:PAS domain S-box-containing protein